MTKSTSGGYDQLEPSPEEIEQELRTALCERRQTDRLKPNYSIDACYLHPTSASKLVAVSRICHCDNV